VNYNLSLEDLTIPVKLGCSDEERRLPQTVIINLLLIYADFPVECKSDNIKDAVCYDTVTKLIQEFCAKKQFHLIEHLGYELHNMLKESINKDVKIELSVSKRPPIANITTCTFHISD